MGFWFSSFYSCCSTFKIFLECDHFSPPPLISLHPEPPSSLTSVTEERSNWSACVYRGPHSLFFIQQSPWSWGMWSVMPLLSLKPFTGSYRGELTKPAERPAGPFGVWPPCLICLLLSIHCVSDFHYSLLLSVPQPQWPPYCSSNTPDKLLPQGLCTGPFLSCALFH